jgi:dTDP-4-dehydrorhamnose reductase
MRILIIGGDGMLGHQVLKTLAPRHDVVATVRLPLDAYAAFPLYTPANTLSGLDVRKAEGVRAALREFRPDAVVNAAGIVKQRGEASEAIPAIEINALFPHRLAEMCAQAGAYLVHFSTDCVFSGKKGGYSEGDAPDPVDLYGRSKLLGELFGPGCVTLRTSMIGPELSRKHGLLEWFLSQKGTVPGYRRAVFSGLTTPEQARIVERVLEKNPRMSGTYHVSAEPISKYELLRMIAREFHLDTRIEADDKVTIDRSLDSSRFRRDFGYTPPSWHAMVAELVALAESAR